MLYNSNYGTLTKWGQVRLSWREFWSILHVMNRQAELERLVAWARRKKLPGPLACYQSRLEDESRRVMHYTLASPGPAHWARGVHQFNRLFFPAPRYHARGSAAAYSRRGMIGKQSPIVLFGVMKTKP